MAATFIVRHRVTNFESWKKIFESMIPVRAKYGWISHLVLRDASDPNMVTVINRVQNLQGAKEYGASAELREGMKNGGVQGPPDLFFSDDAGEHAY
jgi:hypothetical protein